jgi:Alpha-L-arabinofuranosidase B, catalytic
VLELLLLAPRRRFLDGRADVAAAFSLRRLRSQYRGALVRVRRSSDNLEADFGVGPSDVDWSAVSGFTGGSPGYLSKWYDQSGNARHVLQGSAAAQPQIGPLANGLAGVTFDGATHALVSGAFTVNQPTSFNIVYRQVSQTQASLQNVFDGLTGDNQTLYGTTSGQENRLYAGNAGPNGDTGVSMPVGARGAVGGTFNGVSSLLEVNALTIASFTGDAGANSLDGLTLGTHGGLTATRFDHVELQELVLWNTGHGSAPLKADNAAMRAAWRF